jgi:AbiJ N-terminal domain 4
MNTSIPTTERKELINLSLTRSAANTASLPYMGSKDYGSRNYRTELANFLLQQADHEKILDATELSFRLIDRMTRTREFLGRNNASELADSAIDELNARFLEHGVGYRYEEGEVVRVDSELLHAEAVKPALALLRAPEYAGAQAEFLKAHEHYRHGRAKEALAECLKSLESVMKSICAKRKWTHDANATSKALIQVLFDKGLVPTFWSQHFSALRSMLESGVPTARNRLGGHGQGANVVQVPSHLVVYVLHQTASTVVFLTEAEKALP